MKRRPIIHNFKIVSTHYAYIRDGLKDFVICFDDRDYRAEDVLILHEHRNNKFGKLEKTGESFTRRIKYILRKFKGLQTGYIVLSLDH